MKNKFETFLEKTGGGISLSHDERERMRRTLHTYMEMKPVRGTVVSRPALTGWFFSFRPVAATLVLALFVSSAGVSYAAADALPGDLLYAVKTHVNEPVQGALAISTSAKTAWAMDVAGERVKEAATLAAEGRLSTTTQQTLQTSFEEHAKLATASIETESASGTEGTDEAAIRFEAQLSEYENVLTQIGGAKGVDVAMLADSIKTEAGTVAAIRAHAAASIASAKSTDHKAATTMGIAARAQLEVSTKLAHAVSESLSSSSADVVAAQLDDASSTISAGEGFVTRRALPDALGAFQNALSATEKLSVFLKTSSAIHARTGLVIGEPEKAKQATDSRTVNRVDNVDSSHKSPVKTAAITTASLMMATSDVSSSTKQSDASSSTKQKDTDTQSTETSHESTGEAAHVTASSTTTVTPVIVPLPISVPVHLPF